MEYLQQFLFLRTAWGKKREQKLQFLHFEVNQSLNIIWTGLVRCKYRLGQKASLTLLHANIKIFKVHSTTGEEKNMIFMPNKLPLFFLIYQTG